MKFSLNFSSESQQSWEGYPNEKFLCSTPANFLLLSDVMTKYCCSGRVELRYFSFFIFVSIQLQELKEEEKEAEDFSSKSGTESTVCSGSRVYSTQGQLDLRVLAYASVLNSPKKSKQYLNFSNSLSLGRF